MQKKRYKNLSENTKKSIMANANRYSKENYRQLTLRLRPEIFSEFEELSEQESKSKAEMFRFLLAYYTNKDKENEN